MFPKVNGLEANSDGSIRVGLPSRLRRMSQYTRVPIAARPNREQRRDRFAALLPDQDAEHQAAHPEDGEDRADDVDGPIACVGHIADQPAPGQDDRDDHRFEQEPDAPRQHGCDEATDQGSDCGGDRTRGPDQGEDLRPHLAFEVAVDQRLHRGEIERGAKPPDDGPEDDDRGQALREDHCESTHCIEDQANYVGTLAAEEVADLAADQDECGRHERLDRHRGLDAAHRRVEVPDDR